MTLLKQIEKFLIGAVLCLGSGSALGEVVVVVSPNSTLTALNISQVTDIFLGRASHFPNGERAVPVDQAEGSAARNEFYQNYAGRSPSQIKAHWSKLIFTGKGYPPKEVRAQEIKKIVSEDTHLIGYLDSSALDARVKVIKIVDE